MINIINFTSKDNPQWPGEVRGGGQPSRDRGARGNGGRAAPVTGAGWGRAAPRATEPGAGWTRIWTASARWPLGRRMADCLGGYSRRWGDRWYMANDEEACWRGWQTTRTHGGLGRRYRDPAFDSLAECSRCQGAGVRAEARCLPCQGTGRISLSG